MRGAGGGPRVSVLLPARDAAATVAAAVTSILEGAYGDLEIIAVDDGSRDATRAVLDRLAAADPRLRVITGDGRGIVAALQRAHAEARGELIARQDADDWSAPERLARQVLLLDQQPELAAVGCGIRWEPAELVTDGMLRYADWQNGLRSAERIRLNAFVECPVTHATLVVRRDPLARAGGWRDPGWAEDYDLILRMLVTHRMAIGKVADPLYVWCERPERLSRTHEAYSVESFHRARVHYLATHALEPRSEVEVWGAGLQLGRWADSLFDRGFRVRPIEVNPRALRAGHDHIPPERLPRAKFRPLLVALGTPKNRDLMEAALTASGAAAGSDYWMVG